MPTPPTPPVWTISANDVSGGSNGSLLIGCHITENAAGTAYEFTQPNINNVLSTTPGSTLPSVPFSFPSFTYDGFTWTIGVTSLSGADVDGTWATAATPEIENVPAQSGDYTAQTGGGPLGVDEAASTAKA